MTSSQVLNRLAAASLSLVGILLVVSADSSNGRSTLFFGLWRTRHLLLAGGLLGAGLLATLAARSRRALFSGVLALILLGSCALALEAISLIGLVDYSLLMGNRQPIEINTLGGAIRPLVDISGEAPQDIAWRWGLEHAWIRFRYQTDEVGYRNLPGAGEPSVYLVGDSIVVGGLVAYDKTVAAQIAHRRGHPVMNVALVGNSVQEAIDRFQELGPPIRDRDVVVFFFEGNDLLDSRRWQERLANGLTAEDDAEPSVLARGFLFNLSNAMQRATVPRNAQPSRLSCRIDGQQYLFAWTAQSFSGLEEEVPTVQQALESFAERIRSDGGRLTVAFAPSKLRVLGPECETPSAEEDGDGDPGISQSVLSKNISPLRKVFLDWGTRAGIPVVDLTDALVASARRGDVPWFWGDTHWNRFGHAAAAEAIVRALDSGSRGEPSANP